VRRENFSMKLLSWNTSLTATRAHRPVAPPAHRSAVPRPGDTIGEFLSRRKPVKTSAISLIVSLLLAIPGEAFGPPAYATAFIAATNKILDIRDQTVAPTLQEMRQMTALACNAIRQLVADKQFQTDMMTATKISPETLAQRRVLAQDLVSFTNSFLPSEETALLNAGVKPEIAKRLMWSASALRNAAEAKFDGTRVLQNISDLGKELCAAAQTVQQEQNKQQSDAKFRVWTFRIGGIVFIVADLATLLGASTVTAGASPTLITGSTAIGSAIIGWGLAQKN
jgi:hypothetical protein